jgi:hypothetical protein
MKKKRRPFPPDLFGYPHLELDVGRWTLSVGRWTLDVGRWTLDVGRFVSETWPRSKALSSSLRLGALSRPTCIRPRLAHSCSQMSGLFFDNPALRFSRRFSFYQIRVRHIASLLFRWLTDAEDHCIRDRSRCHEAEFPAATQIADQRLFFGSRAADRASTDALRPNYNWVELEDTHDISIIGEKWPAFARRLPQKGRQSPAPAERAIQGAGEEIALGKDHGVFCRWKTSPGRPANAAGGGGGAQRFRAFALGAQT